MLQKGIIVQVTNLNEAIIAEKAGVNAIIIYNHNEIKINGHIKNSEINIDFLQNIKNKIKIPIIVECQKGNFIEAKLLEKIGRAHV